MLLIFITFVLVAGMTFFHAAQGLYSAIIMVLLTIFSAVLAFNYYEPLCEAWLYARMPQYAEPVALVSIFVATLLALRLAFDKFMGRNLLTSMWVDRIAGGVLGFITSMVLVGVLMISVQMLPWGQSIIGWVAFDDTLKRSSSLFPYPDEFTIGLVEMLSGGQQGGTPTGSLAREQANPYSFAHDNLPLELWCARNTGRAEPTVENKHGEYLMGSTAAMPSALTVAGAYRPNDPSLKLDIDVPDNPLLPGVPKDETWVVVIRAMIDPKGGAQEDDPYYRLLGTQFRLVSQNGKSYYPLGYLTHSGSPTGPEKKPAGWQMHCPVDGGVAQPGKLVVFRPADKLPRPTVDWVYRIPAKETLAYMVFRKVARSAVPANKDGMPDTKDALDRK